MTTTTDPITILTERITQLEQAIEQARQDMAKVQENHFRHGITHSYSAYDVWNVINNLVEVLDTQSTTCYTPK